MRRRVIGLLFVTFVLSPFLNFVYIPNLMNATSRNTLLNTSATCLHERGVHFFPTIGLVLVTS